MPKNKIKIFDVTKKNIKRNQLLSFSTVFVTAIVFIISSFFMSLAIMSQKAVKYYEQKSQVIVFFTKDTPEAEILTLRDKLQDPETIESIEYISQADALEIYQEDFEDNPDLISTVTADSLPPSLEIRATSVDNLLTVIEKIDKEKETNAYIDEVMYFKDVVKNLKTLSRIINIGAIVLISALSIITFLIIRITIGFNINAHKEEIQVMHLMGSTDRFIKIPFVIEGAAYGVIGGLISATLIIVPWYILMTFISHTEYALWISQMLSDFGLGFLKSFNITFVLIYYLVHLGVGTLLGTISSLSSTQKYLGLVSKDE
jgi:cell division transport system permease protein